MLGHGWQWTQLAEAIAAIALVALISMTMCFAALRGRVKRARTPESGTQIAPSRR